MTVPYFKSSSYGLLETGKFGQMWIPNPKRGSNKCLAVLLHGRNAPYQYDDYAAFASHSIGPYLAMAGIPAISTELGDNIWANDTAMGLIDSSVAAAKSVLGITAPKICIVGTSMGGATGIRYSSLHPDKVAAFAGIIPLTNINHVYYYQASIYGAEAASVWGVAAPRTATDGQTLVQPTGNFKSTSLTFTSGDVGKFVATYNVGGIADYTTIAAIVDAHTVTLSTPPTAAATGISTWILTQLPSGAAIETMCSAMAGGAVPSRIYYSSGDTVVRPADQIHDGGVMGAELVFDVSPTGGHTDTTGQAVVDYGAGNFQDVIQLFYRNGA